jgi:zinc protease
MMAAAATARRVRAAGSALLALILAGLAACTTRAEEAPLPPTPAPIATEFPTSPPQPGPARSLELPDPDRTTLANGMEVIFVRHGTLPVVHASLVTRGGSSDDPADLEGLAGFTANMLDEGAGGLSALELSAAVSQLGATLRTAAGWDAAHIELHVLRSRLAEALVLMADVAARPDFPAADLERLRQEELTDLTRARDEARIIAGNAFSALVFGTDHPYGRLPSTEAVRRIDRETLERFHRTYYRPGAATLLLVGDVDASELLPAVERAFGSWAPGDPPADPVAPATPAPSPPTVYLLDKPGAAQSEVRIGHPGVARDHPDYFPLLVLNTILGGSFTSRLNTNLRETHGFSYGASSAFAMRRGAGPFIAGAAVTTAKTDSAVAEFFHELRRIRSEPVSAAELDRARSYLALGLPRRFETTSGIASQMAELETYGLPVDFYNHYVRRVMAVTAADVQRVAREHVRPEEAVVVVVGDLATIEQGLRALDLGPVQVRQIEEFVR